MHHLACITTAPLITSRVISYLGCTRPAISGSIQEECLGIFECMDGCYCRSRCDGCLGSGWPRAESARNTNRGQHLDFTEARRDTNTYAHLASFGRLNGVLEPTASTAPVTLTLAPKTMADNSTQLTNTNSRQGVDQDCHQCKNK